LLPAVQAVRETARRTQCLNNLRQVGLAMQNYHDVNRYFPIGCIEPITYRTPKGRQLAWSALLLPYFEQDVLYKQIDFDKAFDSEENAEAAATVVPTYICPSVDRMSSLYEGRAVCDYGGIYGERIDYEDRPKYPPLQNNPPKGTMLYDSRISARHIVDGTSNTLMISEDAAWKEGQWINGKNIFDVSLPINPPSSPTADIDNEIRSQHPHGANGLLADGSVHFLDEQMELRVLAAICTRFGKEVVEDF